MTSPVTDDRVKALMATQKTECFNEHKREREEAIQIVKESIQGIKNDIKIIFDIMATNRTVAILISLIILLISGLGYNGWKQIDWFDKKYTSQQTQIVKNEKDIAVAEQRTQEILNAINDLKRTVNILIERKK